MEGLPHVLLWPCSRTMVAHVIMAKPVQFHHVETCRPSEVLEPRLEDARAQTFAGNLISVILEIMTFHPGRRATVLGPSRMPEI